jgi:hypothetical protein
VFQRRWVHISYALAIKSVTHHTNCPIWTSYSLKRALEVHFAIRKELRVRVLSGSPALMNLSTGGA